MPTHASLHHLSLMLGSSQISVGAKAFGKPLHLNTEDIEDHDNRNNTGGFYRGVPEWWRKPEPRRKKTK